MNRFLVIGLAALLVGAAAPAVAHTETDWDACEKQKNPCTPTGTHAKCTGVRDWRDSTTQGTLSAFGVTIKQSGEEAGVYVHAAPDHGDSDPDVEGIALPGVLWIEMNGFSGLQKANWECVGAQDAHGWDTHGDQVVL